MDNENLTRSKIFCVGLSRTGTTSLHLALVALGLTSAHYPSAEAWAWLNGNYSEKTTRRFQAYSDLPVAVFYKELYKSHPDAKYILTVRNVDAWIRSTKKHFSKTRPSNQLTIFRDYFRLAAYGSFVFHEERYKEKYVKHNADVKDFFSDKKSQFLLIDIDKKFDWETICSFLELPTPDLKFPHSTTPYLGDLVQVDDSTIEKRKEIIARSLS